LIIWVVSFTLSLVVNVGKRILFPLSLRVVRKSIVKNVSKRQVNGAEVKNGIEED